MKTLEVLFTPADFVAFKSRNLDDALCVVFDVFRATSTMITALANGATAVIPVSDIPEALEIRRSDSSVLLAGERNGFRIDAAQTGGVDFDLGNSPREFTCEMVAGKTIVSTTTNGTRALRACAHASGALIGSFLNLTATANSVRKLNPDSLILVCSGTFEETALEDVLGAGALCDQLWNEFSSDQVSDSALMAHQLYQIGRGDILQAASASRNGRKLLANPQLRNDVPICLRMDEYNFVAVLQRDGKVTRINR